MCTVRQARRRLLASDPVLTPQSLARKDHTRDRYKSGVAIANALDLNWRDIPEPEAKQMLADYQTAWETADRKAEVPA
jgi:hypothetical protein